MTDARGGGGGDDSRLHRCIRDLAALNALPSMCVGCSPAEALALICDALPTVLGCNMFLIVLPGEPSHRHGSLDGASLLSDEIDELTAAGYADGTDAVISCRGRKLWCVQLDVPMGSERGRVVIGRDAPLDEATDRGLFRSAANLIGTTLETARVLEAARRKDDFIAVLGHELRNPLASILTAVELGTRSAPPTREQRIIERHTRHLARLVDDLLDVSRISRGQIELRIERVTLGAALERAFEIADPVIRQRGHRLVKSDIEGFAIDGDAVRLAQVFGNLLTNAAKFTPQGGTIEVSARRIGERVRVSVKDNGRGLDREALTRVFEPFVQVDRSHDTVVSGLGLGLAIVKNLVERHNGTIFAESDGRDKGATFTVILPLAGAASDPMLPTVPKTKTPRPRAGVRILVVDDNSDVADLIHEALLLEGFASAVVYNATRALECWPSFRPHAAILDVGLPDMDGYQLARTIRATYGKETKLIAATGYGQASDRRRAVEAGFDLHLVKPVSLSELVRLLDEHLGDRTPSERGRGEASAKDTPSQ